MAEREEEPYREQDKDIGQAKIYLSAVHGKSKGYITLATIREQKYKQWHHKITELLAKNFKGEENTYISMNTFFKPVRRTENIKELNTLYLDLDTYKLEPRFENAEILKILEKDCFNIKVPCPSFVVSSGRGMYFIWLIEPSTYKSLPLWSAIEEYLYAQLSAFGADKKCLDCTRILRIPDSINEKSNTTVEILSTNSAVYTLEELKNQYLPEIKAKEEKQTVKKVGRPCKVVALYNIRSLYFARIQDIIMLCQLRNYCLVGYRETILFLYRYWLCYFTQDAEKALIDTLYLNDDFKPSLSATEAENATRSAEKAYLNKDKVYKYKNETLIDLLKITPEEQTKLVTIIGKGEKRRRRNEIRKEKYCTDGGYNKTVKKRKEKCYVNRLEKNGKLASREKIGNRQKKVLALLQEGLKQKEISIKLNISLRTCKYDVRYLKQNKML